MCLADFKSSKIGSVIIEPFSIPKVAKKCQKEPNFEFSEIEGAVLDLCLSLDSNESYLELLKSHSELNQW